MSRFIVKPEAVLPLLKELAAASRRWGKHANPPYTTETILQAIELADDQGIFESRASAEEVTKLRRQLAACQNREKGRNAKEE